MEQGNIYIGLSVEKSRDIQSQLNNLIFRDSLFLSEQSAEHIHTFTHNVTFGNFTIGC